MSTLDFVVLFGAGASYACENLSPRPPLGWQLFDRLKRQGFFSRLSSDVTDAFVNRGFEAGMAAVYAADKVALVHLQKEIAAHLLQLNHDAATLYDRIFSTVQGTGVWSTLNYDCLADASARRVIGRCDYGLTGRAGSSSLLKLHGSANFAMQDVMIGDVGFQWLGHHSIIDGPVEALPFDDARRRWNRSTDALGPAMSLYMEGKDEPIGPGALHGLRRIWKQAVSAAATIVCVGVYVHRPDRHIWDTLSKSRAKIGFVSPESRETKIWETQTGRRRVFHLAESFDGEAILKIAKFIADRST